MKQKLTFSDVSSQKFYLLFLFSYEATGICAPPKWENKLSKKKAPVPEKWVSAQKRKEMPFVSQTGPEASTSHWSTSGGPSSPTFPQKLSMWDSPNIFFLKLFVLFWGIANWQVVMTLGEQWRDSAIHVHGSILPRSPSPLGRHTALSRVPCVVQ